MPKPKPVVEAEQLNMFEQIEGIELQPKKDKKPEFTYQRVLKDGGLSERYIDGISVMGEVDPSLTDADIEVIKQKLTNDRKKYVNDFFGNTLEDAKAGYEALIDSAEANIWTEMEHQSKAVREMGVVGTSKTRHTLSATFMNCVWLVEDHNGEQKLWNHIKEYEFPIKYEEYNQTLATIEIKIAELDYELARRVNTKYAESSQEKMDEAQERMDSIMERSGLGA